MFLILQAGPLPSAAYCLATSATASPTLFLVGLSTSLSSPSSNLALIASFCGGGSEKKRSCVLSPLSSFRDRVEILLNRTAEKARSCVKMIC
jgi:hypothetical protein